MIKVYCDSCYTYIDSMEVDNWAVTGLYAEGRKIAEIAVCPDCLKQEHISISLTPAKKPVVPFIQPEDPVPAPNKGILSSSQFEDDGLF